MGDPSFWIREAHGGPVSRCTLSCQERDVNPGSCQGSTRRPSVWGIAFCRRPRQNTRRGAMPAELWIGTSGWHYAHWRGPVYPERLPSARWLAFYAQRFRTVEINNSFYLLPGETKLEGGGEGGAAGVCFAGEA